MLLLIFALASFVGSHFLLSHPLRQPLVARLGEGGFTGVYSLVAFATLGWSVFEWRRTPSDLLWVAPGWALGPAAALMFVACILFVGSVATPNPALLGDTRASTGPRGVQAFTRHPMMWAFAIWAVVHATLSGDARTVALCAAILILALVGARLQDGKKRGQLGDRWAAHEAATSFVPFAGQLGGRARWASPGIIALIGGAALLTLATWLHPYAGGPYLWG